jgi:hypothetical protein
MHQTIRVIDRDRDTIPGCIPVPQDRGMCHEAVQRALREPVEQWCRRINEYVASCARRRLVEA